MSLNQVATGKDVPNDFNVIIEIPMQGDPVKYEVDKESGAILSTVLWGLPCNIQPIMVMCRTRWQMTVTRLMYW